MHHRAGKVVRARYSLFAGSASLSGLGLAEEFPSNYDMEDWPSMRQRFTEVFVKRTRDEWLQAFEGRDACVAPVLSLDEAPLHPHNKARQSFSRSHLPGVLWEPRPAPKLSRTPAKEVNHPQPEIGQHTEEVLLQIGYSQAEIAAFKQDQTITQYIPPSSL